jgi:hypothetical protein
MSCEESHYIFAALAPDKNIYVAQAQPLAQGD